MNLEPIILSEVSQKEKNKGGMISTKYWMYTRLNEVAQRGQYSQYFVVTANGKRLLKTALNFVN